ncbi:MAG: site-specific DNA-methyltransferase, partial [Gemmatimonadota bacterium]|nr:site-specific DNA-methyltransferase [Gemmatimonadota bacterium]
MGEPNWSNETMWTGDNLPILRGMNSESIDLIYLDPPFNSKTNYAAPIGSKAAGAEFKDTWTLRDIDLAWLLDFEKNHPKITRFVHAVDSDSDKSYLIYMAPRLLEMRRLLKPTGSIYVHCDPTMSHYLKLILDLIFGRTNFRNEIVWCYTGPGSPGMRQFNRKHDTILWFSRGGGGGGGFKKKTPPPPKTKIKKNKKTGGRNLII